MNIISAQYYNNDIINEQAGIKANIDGQEMFVPPAPDNRHYAGILKWVAEGNTIQEAK